MADDSWPSPAHNDRVITDSEYEILSAPGIADGVAGDPTQTAVVSAAAGLAVSIRANVTASVRGYSWTSGPSAFTLPVAANTSGKARQDWVVLRLDRSAWTVRAAIRQGTPGSGLPTLVQDAPGSGVYEITLAQVNVPNGATNVTVTRNELYAGVAIRPSSAARPNTKPKRGDLEFQTDTGKIVCWSGSGWSTVYAPPAEMIVNSVVTGWGFSVDSWLEYRNGVVTLRLGSFIRQAGTVAGTTDIRLPVLIPDAYRHPTRNIYGLAYTSGVYPARVTVYSRIGERPGQVWLTQHAILSNGDYVMPSTISWTIG
ncbi:hypothetical protein [Streptomyces sp. NPDC088923]|uniref:hypothetical protein n=1 Tax=Streptomyces sp. NPDC088923 TaxID=3365913 RepID=UPI0038013118